MKLLKYFSFILMATLMMGVASGEDLVFKIGWKAATAGTVTIKTGPPIQRRGRRAYLVTCEAATNAVIDPVFRVRDRIESWTDAQALASLGYAEQINEGGYHRNKTVFIYSDKRSYSSRQINPSKGQKPEMSNGSCPAHVQDVLSALLYVRAQPMKVGSDIPFSILNNEKVHDVVLRVLTQESEGLKCELLLRTEKGPVRHNKGALYVWFTADKRHIPMKIACELPIGSLSAELVSRSGE